ncbi:MULTISPECIES: stalk domain-containing protein [Brevibacillus]|uniref:stalk domain-containing protein n=1 Tax=Brevibacillus TaxID=55080 RepID=UPI0011CD6DC5|nr:MULTISPECIES: stalk domain-containing protein [Brevibacillus]MCM3078270.1 copper amine oxidase N-terminal domain-containing protein [Brevibacillus invocatus]MCM3428575.1 copper amine oxidase N-terminal domain-containing protein [Brevibacillus invocatus]
MINGKGFSPEESAVYVSEKQDEIMVPVRTIAEQLGYKLSWNQNNKSIELTKGPHFHMIKIGEDQYNIAKMNMTLGAALSMVRS